MTDLKRLNRSFQSTDIHDWLSLTIQEHPALNHNLLTKACQFIDSHNTITPTDHPTAQLGLAIADLLLTMNSDTHTIVGALIIPIVSERTTDQTTVSELFHRNVTHLLSGVQKIDEAENLHANKSTHHAEHIDNLRKMMLAIIDDARIVLLKLAKQIVDLQRIKLAPEQERRALARHTMDLYAPLANRLGMGQLKWQLEDFAFRYLEPETYSQLSKSLKLRRMERDHFINEMKATLISLLNDAGITDVDVSGRSKHIYSIHKKIQRKQVPFDQIYDASALRILVPEIKDCYTTLGIIHAQWPPIKEEFDDYISQPKPNGYQSIHTAVIFHETLNVEIQIRTHDMHESAELGVAAHWKYKEGSSGKATYEDKIATLRQIIDWQKALSDDKPTQHTEEYTRLFEDRIYVFTPQGDVYDLPVGATPLDFAYYIHTEVGNRCKGAVINGKLEQLTQALKTGDRVEIKTGKVDQPSLDWLSPHTGYITTQ
ncbi:MAG: GTP pyrophosphokinase, partial [Coxiellaceae bacterium]|nr:GTP pyrophosphokinase [Coxiellaceae bacterium]